MHLVVPAWLWELFFLLEWTNQTHKALWKLKFMNAWKKCSLPGSGCVNLCGGNGDLLKYSSQGWGFFVGAVFWNAESKAWADISMGWLSWNLGVFLGGLLQLQAARVGAAASKFTQCLSPPGYFSTLDRKLHNRRCFLQFWRSPG